MIKLGGYCPCGCGKRAPAPLPPRAQALRDRRRRAEAIEKRAIAAKAAAEQLQAALRQAHERAQLLAFGPVGGNA